MTWIRLCLIVLYCSGIVAATPPPPDRQAVADLTERGGDWLLSRQQADGSWGSVAVTALVVDALVGPDGTGAERPALQRALDHLLSFQHPDGGIYSPEEGLGTYCTSFTLLVLGRLPDGHPAADTQVITAAQDYLRGCQRDVGVDAGGFGYDQGKGEADLANTASAIAALRASGVPGDDPAMQRALAFVERCQNLSSHNDQTWSGNDGSAAYRPEPGSGSWTEGDGGQPARAAAARNPGYGGMTYALIASYVYLDLAPTDPRLATAQDWVRKNYQFDANPGMTTGRENEGLFYYFMTMAKTFGLLGVTTVALPDGRVVDWRADLFQAISAKAKAVALPGENQGVLWINSSKRWMEGDPLVATAFMVKGLSRIQSSLAQEGEQDD